MNRTIASRLAALEGADIDTMPIVAFPERIDREPTAFYIGGTRYECGEGERFADAARRVAARLRPGARAILWPLPMMTQDYHS